MVVPITGVIPCPSLIPCVPHHISLHHSRALHQTSCDELHELLPQHTHLSLVLASVILLAEPSTVLPLTQVPAQPLMPLSWALG